ncbi:MAG: transposase [Ignavibacteriales bacterium]|nr:transposase [Ignavibacteriales bacterium]
MESPKYYHMNTYHHLYNQGVNKDKIFSDKSDYVYFLRKMVEYKLKYSVKILCYCLMPNHFHLFVKQITTEHEIGKFIGDLTNAYTKGTNKRYGRTGVLFQGRTKSKLIIDKNHYITLFKYIVNNPVRSGLVYLPEDWEYSSAKEYFSYSSIVTDTSEILKIFDKVADFKNLLIQKEERFDYSILF